MVGQNEVALPAFLEAVDGIDFRTDNKRAPIASGGGGVIRYATWCDYGLGSFYISKNEPEFAIKQVKQTARAVFNQEVALLWSFRNSENIISLLAFNSSDMLIAMPLFKLGPLSRVLQDVDIDWSMVIALQLGRDVFAAQVVVHDAGIVHCDIKSQNYLVRMDESKQYRAVLTDFGVCKLLANANSVSGLVTNTVTGKSINYSSPEVLLKTDLSPDQETKRDVYAGVTVLNELVTRQQAWRYPRQTP